MTRNSREALLLLVEKSRAQTAVRVDAAIAQKRPALSRLGDFFQIAAGNQDFFLIGFSLGDDLSRWTRDKRAAPKFELSLASHAIGNGDIDSVRHRVPALNHLPGVTLGLG